MPNSTRQIYHPSVVKNGSNLFDLPKNGAEHVAKHMALHHIFQLKFIFITQTNRFH